MEDEILDALRAAASPSPEPAMTACFMCGVCGDEWPASDMARQGKFGFKKTCKVCFNALRCLEFTANSSDGTRKALLSMVQNEKEKVRMLAMKVRAQPRQRSSESRAEAAQIIMQFSRESRVIRRNEVALMTKRLFFAHKDFSGRQRSGGGPEDVEGG